MTSLACQDEWALLLRMQADKLQQQQRELKHQAGLRKLCYKRELDHHISLTEGKQKRQKQMDVQMLKQKQRQDSIYEEQIKRKQEEKARLRKEALEQNMRAVREKDQQDRTRRKRESDVVTSLLSLENEAMERERRSESEKRNRQKYQLISAYNEKMSEDRARKEHARTEESIYVQQFKRMEQLKQKQRENFFNKIRYGFKQNPETQSNFRDIQSKKDQERKSAIVNYIGSLKAQEFSFADVQKPNSRQAQRQEQMQKLEYLQKHAETPQQKKRIKEVEGQMKIGDILDQQIAQKEMQKIKEKHMNGREVKYNKDSFLGGMSVPGLSMNDYHRVRQRQILNNSIGLTYKPDSANYYSKSQNQL